MFKQAVLILTLFLSMARLQAWGASPAFGDSPGAQSPPAPTSEPEPMAEGDLSGVDESLPPIHRHQKVKVRLWVGEGPLSLNSYGNAWGNDLSFGGRVEFGRNHQFIAGGAFDLPGSSESSPDPNLYGIHRRSLLTELGFYPVPGTLYVLARLGSSTLTADGPASSGFTVQLTYGASLGVNLVRSGNFELSAQANYLYTPSTSTSGTWNWNYYFLNGSLPYATISSASAASFQLLFAYVLEK